MTISNTSPSTGKQVRLTIFPPLPHSSCGGGSCSCQPSASPAARAVDAWETFSTQLRQAQESGEHRFQIEVAEYTSIPAVRSTLQRLNDVFAASKVNYLVTADELGGILQAYAPIIAIDDRIVATRVFPAIEQLIEMVKTAAAPIAVESTVG